MVLATLAERGDFRAVWWLTAEYTDLEPSVFADELHIELHDPPGPGGVGPAFFREFRWTGIPTGEGVTYTVTPGERLGAVHAVAELLAHRDRDQ